MKKLISICLALTLVFSLVSSVVASDDENLATDGSASEELSDDSAWEQLESLGKIVTENGIFYVYITLPAELINRDITQESIDAEAGEAYTSGMLNEDGSVTYKLTKKQHKVMLDSLTESLEESLQELVDSSDYSFTRIDHNEDFTVFDAYLSTEGVGFAETFTIIIFYYSGGMYALFTGSDVQNIAINFYSSSGNLISTVNSSEMGD